MFEVPRKPPKFWKPKTKEGWIRNHCKIETGHRGQEQHVNWRVARGLKFGFFPQCRTSPSAKEGMRSSLRHQEREEHELPIRE